MIVYLANNKSYKVPKDDAWKLCTGKYPRNNIWKTLTIRRSRLENGRRLFRADLHGTIFVACDKLAATGLRHDLRLLQRF